MNFNEIRKANRADFKIVNMTKEDLSQQDLKCVVLNGKHVFFFITQQGDFTIYNIVPNAVALLQTENIVSDADIAIQEVLNPKTLKEQLRLKPGVVKHNGYNINVYLGIDGQYHAKVV